MSADHADMADELDANGFYTPASWTRQQLERFSAEIAPYGMGIDLGIVRAVKALLDAGVETFESCQGGDGHSMAEPAVRFHGGAADGWKALAVCLTFGLPVSALRRYWDVSATGEPSGPHWEVVFSQKLG